jgi:hypothetical protein
MQKIVNFVCVVICVFITLRGARILGYDPAVLEIKYIGIAMGGVLGLIIAEGIGLLFAEKKSSALGDLKTSDPSQPNFPWSGS